MIEINITGRNLELNDSLRKYIYKRLNKLEQIYSRIMGCEVVLEEEKIRKNVEIILYLKRNRVIAKESSPDIYASIDSAVENVKKQLRRLVGRVRSKRRRSVFKNFIRPVMKFRAEEKTRFPGVGQQDIIKTDAFADKPMLPEEARLELQTMGKSFIMFKNADTGEPNVIYKRTDGSYGLIEPKF